MLLRIGQNVTINDPDNFYFGRDAVIDDITSLAGVTIMTVSLPSGTETGSVSFSIREEFCRPGLPGLRPLRCHGRHLINEAL